MLYKFLAYYNFREIKLENKINIKNIADGNKMLKKIFSYKI
jgi:hypothetical protein